MVTAMLQLALDPNDDAPALARRELTVALDERVSSAALSLAHCIATELIGDALRSEPQLTEPIQVTAAPVNGTVRLTIQDTGPERASSFESPDDDTVEGLSGRMLRASCEASGFERVNDVTIAWCEFPSGSTA
jgi:hypothetical protein